MKMQIRTTQAQIAWNVTNAKQTTPSMPKESLKLDIEKPKMEMDIEDPRVTINQEQCFNESGLMTNSAFLDDMVSRAQSAVMEGISHRVDEGNQMMAIESGVDVVVENASNNAWERFYHEFGMVTMPRSRPQITVEDGDVNYNFTPGKVNVLNNVFEIDKGTYEPWKIEYYMKQKNSITFTPVGDEVDITI